MRGDRWVRRVHRWLSMIFTAAVVLNIVFMVRKEPAVWVGFLALVPLIPLLLTGLYLFVSPYAAKAQGGRGVEAAALPPS